MAAVAPRARLVADAPTTGGPAGYPAGSEGPPAYCRSGIGVRNYRRLVVVGVKRVDSTPVLQ
uniref:Uncharacterized protein n=1 Tax=Oryza sativa subsp. japonica TaxID=39947 RepID=Q6YTV6_ORYSJ|nr:hypothetical protein [Oryza sativa Japonica Group]